MKKHILILFTLLLNSSIFAQQPIDSLYIWVNFKGENIVMDIPSGYFNLRTEVPDIPNFVVIRHINILVPPLPEKGILLQTFRSYLTKITTHADNSQRQDWLRVMALYLYFSHNNLSQLPPAVMLTLKSWEHSSETSEIDSQVDLLLKWTDYSLKQHGE